MKSDWNFVEERIQSKIQLSDRWYRLILNMIKLAGLKLSENLQILEVGCGMGGFCFWANRECRDVIGLDIAKMRIKRANQLGRKFRRKVSFIVGDAQSLPFKDGSYDVVFCSETLEHIPDYIKAFDELVRVTKRSGYIVVTVPNYINMTWLYKPFEFPLYLMGKKPQPDDLHYFNIFVIDGLFSRKDLRIVIKRGIGLISIRSTHPTLKLIENILNRPLNKLKPLCINIGVIAQKIL